MNNSHHIPRPAAPIDKAYQHASQAGIRTMIVQRPPGVSTEGIHKGLRRIKLGTPGPFCLIGHLTASQPTGEEVRRSGY